MGNSILGIANRGSEWHRWEPHIHAPGTVQEDRYPVKDGWDLYLESLENTTPSLRAIALLITAPPGLTKELSR